MLLVLLCSCLTILLFIIRELLCVLPVDLYIIIEENKDLIVRLELNSSEKVILPNKDNPTK